MNRMQQALVYRADQFKSLLGNYDSFGKHPGERGERRENALAEVLREFLPKRYKIDSGEVVAVSGETSKQIDVIIYDNFHSPVLVDAKDTKVVPAESVYAAIELKPNMSSRQELHDALDNVRSVKRLPRTAVVPMHGGHRQTSNPTAYGAIVTYGDHLKHETVLEEVVTYCKQWPKREWIDQICFLDKAVLIYETREKPDLFDTSLLYCRPCRAEGSPTNPPKPKLLRQKNLPLASSFWKCYIN